MTQEQPIGQPSWKERITYDSAVLSGKPVIKGTSIAVEFVIDLLAQEWTQPDILENYPGLSHEDIRACLAYARDILSAERVYPLGA